MSVAKATRSELERLKASGALAATALAMAEEIDAPNSATSKSMCARVLIDTMERLRAAAPPEEKEDRVDEIAQRRARRVRGATAEG
jgi:hypothetical protein